MDSTLEMYSARSAILNNETQYSAFRISELKTEGFVEHIDKLTGVSQFIVGTDSGALAIYDYGSAEVYPVTELSSAHGSAVTGVSSHPSVQSNA